MKTFTITQTVREDGKIGYTLSTFKEGADVPAAPDNEVFRSTSYLTTDNEWRRLVEVENCRREMLRSDNKGLSYLPLEALPSEWSGRMMLRYYTAINTGKNDPALLPALIAEYSAGEDENIETSEVFKFMLAQFSN